MNPFATTCRLCRDFRDELSCAGRALVMLSVVVGVLALIFGIVGVLAFSCIEGDVIWPIPVVLALMAYWGIYKEMC